MRFALAEREGSGVCTMLRRPRRARVSGLVGEREERGARIEPVKEEGVGERARCIIEVGISSDASGSSPVVKPNTPRPPGPGMREGEDGRAL